MPSGPALSDPLSHALVQEGTSSGRQHRGLAVEVRDGVEARIIVLTAHLPYGVRPTGNDSSSTRMPPCSNSATAYGHVDVFYDDRILPRDEAAKVLFDTLTKQLNVPSSQQLFIQYWC